MRHGVRAPSRPTRLHVARGTTRRLPAWPGPVRAFVTFPIARVYDALNAVLFASAGGSGRLRQHLVNALELGAQDRVLEFGCGTGQVTERLVATGAHVVAVDALPAMLVGARRRAPRATFVEGDALTVDLAGSFDAIVLSFVLHNLDTDQRRTLLKRSRSLLGQNGRVAILEWALPRSARRARVWRGLLARIEPSPNVAEVLDGALGTDLATTGLRVIQHRLLTGGRTQLVLATADE